MQPTLNLEVAMLFGVKKYQKFSQIRSVWQVFQAIMSKGSSAQNAVSSDSCNFFWKQAIFNLQSSAETGSAKFCRKCMPYLACENQKFWFKEANLTRGGKPVHKEGRAKGGQGGRIKGLRGKIKRQLAGKKMLQNRSLDQTASEKCLGYFCYFLPAT